MRKAGDNEKDMIKSAILLATSIGIGVILLGIVIAVNILG